MNTVTDAIRRLVGANERSATGPRQAVWNAAVIAFSDRTIVVEGNHYFPLEDVNSQYLESSPRHTVCPWKGKASYYDIAVDGERNTDAAWYYANPSPAAAEIKDHVAFWHGVKVSRTPQT